MAPRRGNLLGDRITQGNIVTDYTVEQAASGDGYKEGSVTATSTHSESGNTTSGTVSNSYDGNAIGAHEGFSWSEVGMAALGGAVTAGLDVDFTGGNAVVRGALSSAMTQGIAVAIGAQDSFSWRSVAASAVGAGVGAATASTVAPILGPEPLGQFGTRALGGFTAGLTTAAMQGGKVDVTRVATDAFGNALGQSMAEQQSSARSGQEEKLAEARVGAGSGEAWNADVQARRSENQYPSSRYEISMNDNNTDIGVGTPEEDYSARMAKIGGDIDSYNNILDKMVAANPGYSRDFIDSQIRETYGQQMGIAESLGFEGGFAFRADLQQRAQLGDRLSISQGADIAALGSGLSGVELGWLTSGEVSQMPNALDTANQWMSDKVDRAQDYYAERGGEALRRGDTFGVFANGVGYTLSAFAPRSVPEVVIGAAAGPLIGKGMQLAMPAIVRAAPVLGRDVGAVFGRRGGVGNGALSDLAMLPPPNKGSMQRAVDAVIRGDANYVEKHWGALNGSEYRAVRNYMGRTEAGQKVLSAADERRLFLNFTEGPSPNPNWIGETRGTSSRIYLQQTEGGNFYELLGRQADGLEYTANIGLHEGLHGLGVGGSRRAEALVRLEELRSMGVQIDRTAMRQVLTDMGSSYDHFRWRAGRTSDYFPGLSF